MFTDIIIYTYLIDKSIQFALHVAPHVVFNAFVHGLIEILMRQQEVEHLHPCVSGAAKTTELKQYISC